MLTTASGASGQVRSNITYGPVAQVFHWLVVVLLVAQYLTELLPRLLPKSYEDAFVGSHVSIGPTILLIMLLRLGWRLANPPPPAPRNLRPSLQVISRMTHWLFYVVLIVLPILGWISASAFGVTAYLFGFIALPGLVAKDQAFGDAIGSIHGTIALALLALIALHISGAAYHALVKRDGVLQRMLPD